MMWVWFYNLLQMENCRGTLLRRHNYLRMRQRATMVLSVFQVLVILTKPVAVVNHRPFVFTDQSAVRYFQRVEVGYVMSSDLFFSAQHSHLACII